MCLKVMDCLRGKKFRNMIRPRPYFRLESESKIKKLQECIKMFARWEESFDSALGNLEREFSPKLKQYDERD